MRSCSWRPVPDVYKRQGEIGRILEVPIHLAGGRIERDRAAGKKVVTWAIGAVEARNGVAGSPIGQVRIRVVGARDIDRAAAGLPGIVLVLPGLGARLAWRWDHVFPPDQPAGRAIERHNEITNTVVCLLYTSRCV